MEETDGSNILSKVLASLSIHARLNCKEEKEAIQNTLRASVAVIFFFISHNNYGNVNTGQPIFLSKRICGFGMPPSLLLRSKLMLVKYNNSVCRKLEI